MFYVLDQGMMRSPQLIALIKNDPKASFVIPDTSLVEMVKSAEWETTMRRSLAALLPALSQTYWSMSIGEAIRIERTSRRPVTRGMLLAEDGTRWLREIIKAVAGTSGKSDISSRIEGMRASLVAEELDAAREKQTIQGIVNALFRDGGPGMVTNLRNGRMHHAAERLSAELRCCQCGASRYIESGARIKNPVAVMERILGEARPIDTASPWSVPHGGAQDFACCSRATASARSKCASALPHPAPAT
jgi:hypothetical protein